jgi:MoxR-like ATPase
MSTSTNPFDSLKPGLAPAALDPGLHAVTPHWWSQAEIDALSFAWAARRPLLIRGEPGSGKSQLAYAAAEVLGAGTPIKEVIHPRFEPIDLFYRFDTMQRLADSQMRTGSGPSALDLTNRRYVSHGVIWQAFQRAEKGNTVLLIDEIDKADTDLPNSLLDALGARSFMVPPLNQRIEAAADAWPFILITTNEDREMPAAFLRRCAVLNLDPPAGRSSMAAWMRERVSAHPDLQVIDGTLRDRAIDLVLTDRQAAATQGFPKVGLAELVDLLNALVRITEGLDGEERSTRQGEWLDRMHTYALVKRRVAPGADDAASPGGGKAAPNA